MLFIAVTIEKQMTPTRRFEDHGAGPTFLIKEALAAFYDEIKDAQVSANVIGKPVTVELVNSATNEPILIETREPLTSPDSYT